ncbi:putative bifunctional diguanylate cyclase/phosphodiesterase [Geodermatophilus ruber]|uniref:Diguanylate cyclase (GGDEF) domain-containing protein n=1 Tax=Geodermatophilus ruber TaxID=504800 RepID=A0A1I4FG54_9ACTN|nr:EAL domain-containing protein [Geodermatophilus ruber]SFL15431.1 diguanylate cyclase (GGDEF) domain-containing protein [Geodermatophilus ruber]
MDDGTTGPRPGRSRAVLLATGAAAVLAAGHAAAGDGVTEVLPHLLLSLAGAAGAAIAADRLQRSSRERTQAELAHLAFHDGLTGLANRALFTDRLELALRRTARSGGEVAVVYLDLDGFKNVNDSLGHHAGDRLIGAVAQILQGAVRSEDTLARLGGDEFAILVERAPGVQEATRIAERILTALSNPVDLGGQRVTVSASLGISTGDVAATASSLLRDADNAMYWAKGAGRGGYVVFNPQMRSAAAERRQLEEDLWAALPGGQFRLVYQPVVDLGSERVMGFEALLRWDHPTLGVVLPERFLPVAEDIGLIPEIGRWVLAEACAAAAGWRRSHPGAGALSMAVNVSPSQLGSPGLIDDVRSALESSGLPAAALVLELTESVLVRDPLLAAERLHELRGLGVRVALDDFGTGYSSLSHLRQFAVDILKIDRSFVSTIDDAEAMPAILRGLINLGRTLDLEIVAEGIEQERQRSHLREGQVGLAQGYLFAAPLEHTDAELLLLGQAEAPAESP